MEKRVVEITVSGQKFVLKTDLDDNALEFISQTANSRIESISSAAPSFTPQKVALLAVLDLAEELFHEKKNLTDLKENIRTQSTKLLYALNESRNLQSKRTLVGDNPPGEG